jgi:hypothetical protein
VIFIFRINYRNIPVTTTNSMSEFNEVVDYCKKLEANGDLMYGMERTKSGGISYRYRYNYLNKYEVKASKVGAELLVCSGDEGCFRLQYRTNKLVNEETNKVVSGYTAYKEIKRLARQLDNVDIEQYFINNGEEVKKSIESPYIKFAPGVVEDKTYYNMHHIDINSSYPSGICDILPIPNTINMLYQKRHENSGYYKLILNSCIGYFQSLDWFKAKLAQVSKHCIAKNNRKIEEMTAWLLANGRKPILYNTDGIWFQGAPVDFSSKELGAWKQDHKDCIFRAKSAGSYEFIEDGKYTPVVRGLTKLDSYKPRELWNWGDIYQDDCKVLRFIVDDTSHNIIVYKEN